ncbi:kinase-like domain-containing protein [Epithele typhae]|uniref:kinase-like domain-containing protein n=1 Tax=Epithele typhae TaxID=378194 RepID=UPI002007ECD1|nr:kinase-like domain-containing protein [Epithele typhae]KAH9921499.1 kinase-like domain-containing protein [Epithele typhae]
MSRPSLRKHLNALSRLAGSHYAFSGGSHATATELLKPSDDVSRAQNWDNRLWAHEEPVWKPYKLGETPGYAPLQLGECLVGMHAQYRIIRKLGWGAESNIWLVERVASKHSTLELGRLLVAKVLTAHASELEFGKTTCQMPLLNEINHHSNPREEGYIIGSDHIIAMADWGAHQSRHGIHAFSIMLPMSTTVHNVRRTFRTVDPSRDVMLVRRVLMQMCFALGCVHELGYIHGDVKADNISVPLFATSIPDLKRYLEEVPAESLPPRIFPEHSPDPITCVKSQPYPPIGNDHDVHRIFLKLGDFSSAIRASTNTTGLRAMPRMLRAPEIILGHRWGQPIDVWALGCLTAELLLHESLFHPGKDEDDATDSEHLAQMIDVLGPFSGEVLANSPLRDKFFNANGMLKLLDGAKRTPLSPLRHRLAKAGLTGTTLDEVDALLRRMLTLDPDWRPAARRLFGDPFIKGFDLNTNSFR